MKIEVIALLIGLFGSTFVFISISNYAMIPDQVREFVSPGTMGARLLISTVPAGLIGVSLFPINLLMGKRRMWGLRLAAIVGFLVLSLSWGLYD